MKLNTTILTAFIATSALAFNVAAQAQQPPAQGMAAAGCDGAGPKAGMRDMMQSMGNPAAMAEKRLERIKSELKLTAPQESLWRAYADKVKAEAGQGMKSMREVAQDQTLSAPERMTRMMNAMKDRMTAMQSSTESFKSLYDSLSAEQKAIADKQVAMMGHMGRAQGGRPGRTPPQGGEGTPR
jgi:delta 1-pyrroline-5-carboxylate dehydrogenase